MLGTVSVKIVNQKGKAMECRALLDSGSQLNFITERIARRINLREINDPMYIQGIGDSKQRSQHRVNIEVKSITNGYSTRLEAFILPQITSPQPAHELDISSWPIPQNIELADPRFNHPGQIDLLIGAELYHQLLSIGQIKLGPNLPTLQNTVFGWMVAGMIRGVPLQRGICGISTGEKATLEEQMEKFWSLEEAQATQPRLTIQERKCENHFAQTAERNSAGRFTVRLPFMQDPRSLGESQTIASRRLFSIERKLRKNEEMNSQYKKFMREYLELGHMKEIDFSSIEKPYCFLPHHAVLKADSSTTKLRVVFDASAKTSSNIALNDILGTGPTIQDDLFAILLRFRMPRFVFTADIEKMYRQIMVHPEDRKYQLILWRDDPDLPVKCYELQTVTYGTTSAPYLATKCIQQLAVQSREKYPLGSATAQKDFYVDDLMTGTNSLAEALATQNEVSELFKSAGFKLRKWCANHPQLLQNIPREDKALQMDIHETEDSIKTLGLTWLPNSDEFTIRVSWPEGNKVTKRTVLSDIAHLFDPLGIMSPVVVTAKIFLQQLWRLKLDWDASLPVELHTTWVKFRQGLRGLSDIKIPRHMFAGTIPKVTQIHAFADASEKAYGAAVYLRSVGPGRIITVRLLCAKSRVAPPATTTIPRLELCAAKLTADLVNRVKTDLGLNVQVFYWTDSTAVLSWINTEPALLNTFVANRVADIQELTLASQWRHVRSAENPADIVSRGLAPEKLASHTMWFHGPIFLYGSEKVWPEPYVKVDTDLEKKRVRTVLTTLDPTQHFMYSIDHRNNFGRWQRIIAYILRFLKNCRKQNTSVDTSTKKSSKQDTSNKKPTPLSPEELEEALMVLVKEAQEEGFSEELRQLRQTGHLSITSALNSLSPFIDDRGIIRVGGRLEAADLPYDARHPMLLPYSHQVTRLLMIHLHVKNLHASPQALMAITRQRFWPVKGKSTARSILQNCVQCARAKPKLLSQFMGNLPAHRVQPARPFVNAGVDFFGPCWIHFKARGKRPQKAYVEVLCCFATKAAHFEVVSDLSTSAFIGALKRFTGRRGCCRNLYCDNATNFVGANNQLAELKEVLHTDKSQRRITEMCSSKGIEFHFIPPRAPHFGGLWEAAVKSAKYFLQRNIASAPLTYEELETLMIEVEAILNSRPLTPLSADPNDLSALTPGHFLIGEPLTTLPDPMAQPRKVTLLERWKLVAEIKNQFWQRWSKEYLSELQHRYKWKQQYDNVKPGTMVVIKEDNLPAAKWQLGRIIETIKGKDGLVRVADIKTTSGVLRRAIHKLAPLPIKSEEEQPKSQMSTDSSPQQREKSHRKTRRKHKSSSDDAVPSTSNASIATTHRETPTAAKKARHGMSLLSIALLTLLILPALAQVKITPFSRPPGLYYENMGYAHLVSNDWKLVIYYNMSMYWREFGTIKHGVTKLNDMCNLMKENMTCEPIIAQFRGTIEEVENNNEFLLHSSRTIPGRIKRAPLNIIGNIAGSLFGVLDSEYANKMAKVIENLKANDNQLLDLIKNQTSIIDSTANIMKGAQEETGKRLSNLELYLNNSISKVNSLNQELKSFQTFTSLSLQLVLIITNYQRIQATLLDVIIDTHHGKINPQLLAPKQLHRELALIQEHLPSSLRLPAKPDDLIKLYSLMTIEGRVAQNQIIFRLKLPLFSYEQFELLRVVPVPFPANNTYKMIHTSTNYLIVNLHRDQYYPITEQELQACIIGNMDFICKQHHPLYNKGSNTSSCEISVISHWPFPAACQALQIANPPRWTQLLNPNQWIYFMANKTTINIVCEATVVQKTLEGSGILQLSPNCAIKDELMTIQGHNVYSSTLKGGFTPSRNLTEFVKPPTLINLPYDALSTDNTTKHLEELQKSINDLKLNEQLPSEMTQHDTHQYAIGYVCLLFIIIIMIYQGWKYTSSIHRTNTPRPPVPLPRTISRDEFRVQVDIEE